MPQFLIDWNQWWLNFWINNPMAFWLASIGAVALVALGHYLRKPK